MIETKRYEIIHLNGEMYITEITDISVGDWYYTSLEHDKPWITQCKSVDKSKEYWLDGNLKYLGYSDANWGSYKIIATTNKSLNLPLLPPVDLGIHKDAYPAYDKYMEEGKGEDEYNGLNIFELAVHSDGFVWGYTEALSIKKYSEEDIMTWYKYVKTHTCGEAFAYLHSLTPKPIAVEVEVSIDFDNPPEGYYTHTGSGKYWEDKPVLMKKLSSNSDKEPNYKIETTNNIVHVVNWVYEEDKESKPQKVWQG